MSNDEVKAAVEKAYGVTVLRMKEAEFSGKPALAVTVMNKGGNDNRAFQVNTLLIDPDTGRLVPVYRARPDGYQLSDILESDPNKQPSDLLATRNAHPGRGAICNFTPLFGRARAGGREHARLGLDSG